MKRKKEKLEVARVELTPAAKETLDAVLERKGMKQTAVLSRLVEWFAVQPYGLQQCVLGHIPEEMQGEVARLMLKGRD